VPASPSSRPGPDPPAPGGSDLPSRRAFSIRTPLSSELEALLAEAERRVSARLSEETALPTPEEEIEAVLPAEILSSLDEPIDDEGDDPAARGTDDGAEDAAPAASLGRGLRLRELHARETTNPGEARQAETTFGGGQAATTTGSRTASRIADLRLRAEKLTLTSGGGNTPTSAREASRSDWQAPPSLDSERSTALTTMKPETASTLGSVLQSSAAALHAAVATAGRRGGAQDGAPSPKERHTSLKAKSVPPPLTGHARVLGERDALVVLAQAIAARTSGTLCFDSAEGVRRAVLREGDLVTAASGVESESLLGFLGARGDLPREQLQQMAGKVAAFGRHAGAALVAHGCLRQDQLWPVLRAHAEWVLGKAILIRRGKVHLEVEPPGRLRNEPSVFGGSTGAEVFVEIVRRAVSPEDATARLGGLRGQLGCGRNSALLSECALEGRERELLMTMEGATLDEWAQSEPGAHRVSLLYALSVLGVVDVLPGVEAADGAEAPDGTGIDALDEDAIRARVRARLEVVDEGDYFAVLGVEHDATGYEVRRAFLDLRRAFDPSRLLSPQVADLSAEVGKITDVLDEAYEILSDATRRERYRRAISVRPKE
jgi:hypothetical protein